MKLGIKSAFVAARDVVTDKACLVGGGLIAVAGSAMAEPTPLVDWAATAAEVKTEASPAITAAIGVGVAFLAVAIGYKMIRRFAR